MQSKANRLENWGCKGCTEPFNDARRLEFEEFAQTIIVDRLWVDPCMLSLVLGLVLASRWYATSLKAFGAAMGFGVTIAPIPRRPQAMCPPLQSAKRLPMDPSRIAAGNATPHRRAGYYR
jgi:hypothetical protein